MAGHPDAFEAVLIGAGQANNPLSRSLAGAGKRVALIEKGKIGGTCVNTGCTPTKTMAAGARVAYPARRAGEFGVHAGAVEFRLDEVRLSVRVDDRDRGMTGLHLLAATGRTPNTEALNLPAAGSSSTPGRRPRRSPPMPG